MITLLAAAMLADTLSLPPLPPLPEPPEPPAPRKPNVIMILADDLGYGDLGCYGALNVETPEVDRLAARGVRFTDCHAVAATSTPSRYAILTGEYPWRKKGTDVAAGNAGMIIRPEQYTMADMFRSQGYTTGAFGKWHLGLGDETGTQDWNAPLPVGLADIGFDRSYIMAATADRVPCVFIEDGMVADYDSSAPIEVSYKANFPGEPTGRDNPEQLYNQRPSHGHDMSIVNGISRIGYMKGGGKALWKDENIADSITSHAIEFMEQNADKPFFMYFATNDVHVPRFPHERFRGKSGMGVRGDAIAQFDWSVGRILATLDSLGIADNTIVILTSDNGPVVDDGYDDQAEELLNGHSPTGGLRGGKYSSYEGGTTVPLIVCWPGRVAEGQTSGALFSQIDFLSSLAALSEAKMPKGSAPDSHDASAILTAETAEGRPWLLEYSSDHTLSLRTPRWKYIDPSFGPEMITWGPKIETGNSPHPQLYDMKTDSSERHNLALAKPDVVYDLQALLAKIRAGIEK